VEGERETEKRNEKQREEEEEGERFAEGRNEEVQGQKRKRKGGFLNNNRKMNTVVTIRKLKECLVGHEQAIKDFEGYFLLANGYEQVAFFEKLFNTIRFVHWFALMKVRPELSRKGIDRKGQPFYVNNNFWAWCGSCNKSFHPRVRPDQRANHYVSKLHWAQFKALLNQHKIKPCERVNLVVGQALAIVKDDINFKDLMRKTARREPETTPDIGAKFRDQEKLRNTKVAAMLEANEQKTREARREKDKERRKRSMNNEKIPDDLF